MSGICCTTLVLTNEIVVTKNIQQVVQFPVTAPIEITSINQGIPGPPGPAGPSGQILAGVTCESATAVGDVVIMSSGVAIRAICTSYEAGSFAAVIISKESSTSCTLQFSDLTPAIYSGLIENQTYYLSDSVLGGITPSLPDNSGDIDIIVGQAFSNTRLIIRKQILSARI